MCNEPLPFTCPDNFKGIILDHKQEVSTLEETFGFLTIDHPAAHHASSKASLPSPRMLCWLSGLHPPATPWPFPRGWISFSPMMQSFQLPASVWSVKISSLSPSKAAGFSHVRGSDVPETSGPPKESPSGPEDGTNPSSNHYFLQRREDTGSKNNSIKCKFLEIS